MGDTPELFVGALLVLGIIAGLVASGAWPVAAGAAPVLVALLLAASARRAARAAGRPGS